MAIIKKEPSRAAILISGTIIFLFAGIIYAWSILSGPFSAEFGWNSAQLGLNYTITIICFTLGIFVSSLIIKKVSARIMTIFSGVLYFAGYFCCAYLNPDSIGLLYLGYGILIGSGAGFVYTAVLGVVIQHFLDKKGFASGMLMMGFGISTLVMGNIADKLFSSSLGWKGTYMLFGVLTAVVFIVGSIFMVEPTKEEAEANAAKPQASISRRQYTPVEMIKTKIFYILLLIILLGNFCNGGVTGHSKYIVEEAGVLASLAPMIVGLQSVCNGLSRVGWGFIYDKFGKKILLIGDAVLFMTACLLIIIGLSLHSGTTTAVGVMTMGLAYGGIPITLSTLCEETFGSVNYSTNFSLCNMGSFIAAFSATIAGLIQTASGSYLLAVLALLVGSFILVVCNILFLKEAKHYV